MKRIIAVVLIIFSVELFAVEVEKTAVEPYISELQLFNPWGIGGGIKHIRNDFAENFNTEFYIAVSGATGSYSYNRNNNGTIYAPESGSDKSIYLQNNYKLTLGILQNLIPKDDYEKRVYIFANYILRYNKNSPLEAGSTLELSGLPDRFENLQNSLAFAIAFDTIKKNPWYKNSNGILSAVIFETAPKIINEKSDYNRINISLKKYTTFFENETVTIYMANSGVYDKTWGKYVTINARKTLAPAGSVRGNFTSGFDGNEKIIINNDIRINFPNLLSYSYIPGVIIGADTGFYDNMSGNIDFGKNYSAAGIYGWLYVKEIMGVEINTDFVGGFTFSNEGKSGFRFNFGTGF